MNNVNKEMLKTSVSVDYVRFEIDTVGDVTQNIELHTFVSIG